MDNRKKILIRWVLLATAVLVIVAIVFAMQVKSRIDRMIIPETDIGGAAPAPESAPPSVDKPKDFYVLVIGLDYRDNHDALLTDTLMVMHVLPQEPLIQLLSIPRDLLVENTQGQMVKINSLFAEGYNLARKKADDDPSILTGDTVALGTRKMEKAILGGAMANTRNKIEQLLDIDIEHMVLVNFDTVISLVDAVGGIEIDVKRSMQYHSTDLYLEPGLQVLDGKNALGYARFREDDRGTRYYASDFERGQHQQEVVKALADKILSWGSLPKALNLLTLVSDTIKTDMDYKEMYTMMTKYYGMFKSSSFVSVPFPEHYSAKGDASFPMTLWIV